MSSHDNDPAAFRVITEIGIIEQLARNQLESLLPDGMKAPHFAVLNHCVRLGDGRTPAQLASALQVTRGAMTNTLQRLEARGYIELRPTPGDGRSKEAYLKPAGRAARKKAVQALAGLVARLNIAMDESDFAAMLPALQRLRGALDRDRDQTTL